MEPSLEPGSNHPPAGAARPRRRRRPKVYFSLRSPFSWMAVRRLFEQVPDADEQMDFIPFIEPGEQTRAELEAAGGEFHYRAMSKAKHLYILNDTKRLAAVFGYDMKWPIDIDPDWEVPHLAWIRARDLGVHREFYDAVMAARWERGENICDLDVLAGILLAAGLPATELVAAHRDPAIRVRGVEALMSTYTDDVFGVPYFILGRDRFWGLDRLDAFVAAHRSSLPTHDERPDRTLPAAGALLAGLPTVGGDDIPNGALVAVGAFDDDSAGGCG